MQRRLRKSIKIIFVGYIQLSKNNWYLALQALAVPYHLPDGPGQNFHVVPCCLLGSLDLQTPSSVLPSNNYLAAAPPRCCLASLLLPPRCVHNVTTATSPLLPRRRVVKTVLPSHCRHRCVVFLGFCCTTTSHYLHTVAVVAPTVLVVAVVVLLGLVSEIFLDLVLGLLSGSRDIGNSILKKKNPQLSIFPLHLT
ncbi:hypothetical protein V8G54_013038 [Vigna mungo]|uniref:Uncharacterized protein n=1 Tax=Vigna mungo TaxID=3915 RepID=A0AAQ3NVE1_VIGMU